MGERFIDLLFPAVCLMSSVFIAMGSLGLDDKDARNQGLTYAGTMLTISGATYQINVKNRSRDE